MTTAKQLLMAATRQRHPPFIEAVVADARITAERRGERAEFRSRADAVAQMARLALVSDGYLAMVCYRLKASLQRRGVPVVPRLLHRMAMMIAQISIGDPVVIEPGVYIAHGQVVIDGFVDIGAGTAIAPWTSIGLKFGTIKGPTIGRNCKIGTGSRLLGSFTIGDGAQIGANAVVLGDVPAGAVAVGIPARVIDQSAGGS